MPLLCALLPYTLCPPHRCVDEVITVAAMLSADHVFAAASGLTGPQQAQQGGPSEPAQKLQALAKQVRHTGLHARQPTQMQAL
jgi:hypothetical protein